MAQMKCATCQQEIESSAKFCSEYSSSRVAKCASCGATLKPGAKFCSECGAIGGYDVHGAQIGHRNLEYAPTAGATAVTAEVGRASIG